nr:hypothetical protein [Tanacetum cinerariifolium]
MLPLDLITLARKMIGMSLLVPYKERNLSLTSSKKKQTILYDFIGCYSCRHHHYPAPPSPPTPPPPLPPPYTTTTPHHHPSSPPPPPSAITTSGRVMGDGDE